MNCLSFYIDKFIYSQKEEALDLSFIPANTRRRLNIFDKHVLYLVNKCLDDKTENIILSSRYGEFDRLVNLISQYKEYNEVSPIMFSASVHNYPLGQFSILTKRTIPTLSVAAGEDSFINGLVTAAASPQNNIIYCYTDDTEDIITGICFNMQSSGNGNKYSLRKAKPPRNKTNLGEITEFFEGKKNFIQSGNFIIERM